MSAAALMAAGQVMAQQPLSDETWNRELYPDYNPTYSNPDPALLKYGRKAGARKTASAQADKLPEYVNNAASKYFPPVFNQDGGSCGSASRICYMFTHELNSYRDTDASLATNRYPSHFVWLLTNGNSGKDEFVSNVGVPSAATYGGGTYSQLFGNQVESQDDFGWMTGYDKWYEGFFNRMHRPTTNPYSLGTEEGRLAAKAWLYNHAGDNSFHQGGLIGLGVASGGQWGRIPKTENNDRIGVTNMYFVEKWGTQVDHAVTMVGYDDRIEFDLDGNGVYGEADKDEIGAWIIVNSWGGWCNDGFIYCPYAYAGSRFNSDGKFSGDWWYGELYRTRKDYRPLRTIKLKMEYSRRSEMLLQVGVSSDLNATVPENIIDMHHFRYAGDGNYGNTNPAPEIPMLGRWADGKLHKEPMEFGYDLTDLSASFDSNKPLKYFFIINTKGTAIGEGKIRHASIIDYEHNTQGVETMFEMGDEGTVEIKNGGKQTVITAVVQGAGYQTPQGLSAAQGKLTWNAPIPSGHTLTGYNIYYEGQQLGSTDAQTLSYAIDRSGCYAVSAVYAGGKQSAQVTVNTTVLKPEENVVLTLRNGGFSIPDIFSKKYDECTIEYYICPNSLTNYNNAYGPGWGTFLAHCNAGGSFSIGWDTNARINTSGNTLLTGRWNHLTLVVKGGSMSLYSANKSIGSTTSNNHSGIGGFGNLEFRSNASTQENQLSGNDCSYDEIRIWNRARTPNEIMGSYSREFHGDVMPEGLIAYYKGDTFEKDGNTYLRDHVGGHHALLTNANFTSGAPAKELKLYRPKDSENILSINNPEEAVIAGIPVTLTTTRGDGIRTLSWSVPALGIENKAATDLSVTFAQAGTYEVSVTGTDYEAESTTGVAREITATLSLTVVDSQAPDASFRLTQSEVPSGESVSLHAANPMEGFSYVWSTPGAEQETHSAPSVATVYEKAGTYEITLTVTSPTGQKAQQAAQLTVKQVKPQADFTISQGVIEKGQSTVLQNTSKHAPTQLQWSISSPKQDIIVNGGNSYRFTPTEPGVYNLTLKATNEVGSDSKTQERAIIVTNADSRNGLQFTQSAARVSTTKPLFVGSSAEKLTISWWMNPQKLSNYCTGIGESTATLLLRTDASGNMHFHAGGGSASSSKKSGYVIPGQWHLYTVTFNKGQVAFYRDAVQYATGTVKNGVKTVTSIPCPATFSLGTDAAPMAASIDELSVWECVLSFSLQEDLFNQPIEDPERYVTGEKDNYYLRLYYQFNQTGGDVQDITSNANHGTRTNFGPDGDAWALSKGVFCLNFGDKQDDVVVDGIHSTSAAPALQEGTFTLSGQRVSDGKLPRGIYIKNNKKVIVK